MIIRSIIHKFESLRLFIRQTDIFKDTSKILKVVRCAKIQNKLPGSYTLLVLLCLLPLSLAQAQIQIDGSLGSAQSLSGPDYVIHEELGKRAGNNLFHSFSEFSIRENESATFKGASEITNVISRVTGEKPSTINGLLKSEIVDANLYFINPEGVLFGANASLSINGSFHASTADFIRLGDESLFYSKPLQSEVLSTAAPNAFGFFGESTGTILVDGSQLNLDDKATLSLVGGKVTIEDDTSIHIPQGQINVVGVDSAGEAVFDRSGGHQDLDAHAFARLNTVNIVNRNTLNADGEGGGRVVIRGGQLVLKDSVISARTTGETDGAGVDIAADHFDLVRSRLDTTTTESGNAGEILMDTKTLVLNGIGESDGVGLFANSADLAAPDAEQDVVNSGRAGTIKITADQLKVLGEVAIETTAGAPEHMGMIDLSTSELTLDAFDAEFQFNEGIGKIIRFTDGNIVLDGSLHPDREGDVLTGPNYEITADMGRTSGNNLFHSFRDFFVDEGERVTFLGPEAGSATVSNIITRVTGDNATNIYGDITSDIPEADLYFINPNGLFFGSGATLNLPGSFHIGTADYLAFQDGERFNVSVPDDSIPDSNELRAYGFNDEEIGKITLEGRLFLNDSETFSLIGGDLYLWDNSRVVARSGHINLVSVQSTGEASIVNGSNDLDVSEFSALGDIAIVDYAAVNVNGRRGTDKAVGRLLVRGNDLTLDNDGEIRARNRGEKGGGSVDVGISGDFFIGKESGIEISGDGILGQISVEANTVTIDGTGQRGFTGFDVAQEGSAAQDLGIVNLTLTVAETLNFINGGIIDLVTSGSGESGSAVITANNLTIDGKGTIPTGIFSGTRTQSNGGSIDVTVNESLEIINAGSIVVSTWGPGDGGTATIKAGALTLDSKGSQDTGIYSSANSSGNGGNLIIEVDRSFKIFDGGRISSPTFGTGDAGTITIRANDLTIDGKTIPTGISSFGFDSTGNGGSIDITVNELFEIIDIAIINVSGFGTGNAGEINIRAKGDINISGAIDYSDIPSIGASAETTSAGNLNILAGGNVRIENASLSISAEQENFDVNDLDSFQQSALRVEAGDSIHIKNSVLSTDAGTIGSERGAGGNIYLLAPTEIWLENSTLLAQAGYAGGNVFIDPLRYIVISSDVIAQANVQGGNYSVIVTEPFGWIQSADSLVDLSGEQSGSVLSNTSPFDLGAELSDLDTDFLNVKDWISKPCEFRLGGAGSSFIKNGWRGVSNNTDDFLPSEPILLADYNFSEAEPVDDEWLREAIFPELNDGCDECQ